MQTKYLKLLVDSLATQMLNNEKDKQFIKDEFSEKFYLQVV